MSKKIRWLLFIVLIVIYLVYYVFPLLVFPFLSGDKAEGYKYVVTFGRYPEMVVAERENGILDITFGILTITSIILSGMLTFFVVVYRKALFHSDNDLLKKKTLYKARIFGGSILFLFLLETFLYSVAPLDAIGCNIFISVGFTLICGILNGLFCFALYVLIRPMLSTVSLIREK